MKCLYVCDLDEDFLGIKKSLKKNEDNLYCRLVESYGEKEVGILYQEDLYEEDPTHVLINYLLKGRYDLVVGKGFGAVFALILGRVWQSRTVLINPMYPAKRYIPYAISDYPYTELLSSIEFDRICWDTKKETLNNVFVILSKDNDVIDAKRLNKYFKKGNSIYVSGGSIPNKEELQEVFNYLVSDPLTDPETIREGLAEYEETGFLRTCGSINAEKDIEQNGPPIEDGLSTSSSDVIPNNGEPAVSLSIDIEADEDGNDLGAEDEEDSPSNRPIEIIAVDSENGNLTIKWKYIGSDFPHLLYLYFKDGAWYRDNDDGLDYRDSLLNILQQASLEFLSQTRTTSHAGQTFWGWGWL